MKVINLFGGPGSGKSTTAAGLFYQMKLKHLNVELITEYAKQLVYSDCVSFLNSKQEHVFAEQNLRQLILKDKVDYAITDSPLALSLIYPTVYNTSPGQHFDEYVVRTIETYDNINFFLARPDIFSMVGRVQDLDEAIRVDNMIMSTLNMLGIPYQMVSANNNTVDTILKHLTLE